MVTIEMTYEGQLRCQAKHAPSGMMLATDAPVDNHGRGESFSPTDLVATSLVTCMSTIMGIAAEERKLDLKGMRMVVRKIMSQDLPRRIAALEVDAYVPLAGDHPACRALENAAMTCPVTQSLHPEIELGLTWHWEDPA